MAMVQIGIPARTVIERIESVRAARNETAAEKLNGRPPSASDSLPMPAGMDGNGKGGEPTGEESEGSPTLFADAPAPSGSNEKKARSPGEVAGPSTGQRASGDVARLSDRSGIAPELKLIAINDARGHPHAAKRVPARSPRVSLAVIEGGLHADIPSASA